MWLCIRGAFVPVKTEFVTRISNLHNDNSQLDKKVRKALGTKYVFVEKFTSPSIFFPPEYNDDCKSVDELIEMMYKETVESDVWPVDTMEIHRAIVPVARKGFALTLSNYNFPGHEIEVYVTPSYQE